MTTQSNLEIVRSALMAMYDYIDGGTPCPYDTPETWRHHLKEDATKALEIIRRRLEAESFALDGVVTVASSAPQPASAPVSSADSAPASEAASSAPSSEEMEDIKARRARDEAEKKASLRKALLRLKKKQD